MSEVLLLNQSQTRVSLSPAALMPAIATALVAISRGEVSAPPRIAARTPSGILGAMPAYVPSLGLAGKLVSIFPSSEAVLPGGVPRHAHRGVVAFFDEHDGRLLALMDAESITAERTAATATLAMQTLAGREPGRIAVVGTGEQARTQVMFLRNIACLAVIVVGGRSIEAARETASLHPSGTADTIAAAVEGADVVFCCTDSLKPVIQRAWLSDGAHVSSIGGTHGPEIDQETIYDGSVFVEWEGAVTSPPPAGAHELQGLVAGRATLIGQVLDNQRLGRRTPSELTVFKSTGHAALDTAAASIAYKFAVMNGIGTTVEM